MRAITHLYCIRKLPLQKIVFIHSQLGKIIQERMANPKRDIDTQYVRNQQNLNQLKEKSHD